jgi:hypothetical protein
MDQQLERAKSSSDSMADALSSEKIAPARSASKQASNEPESVGRMRQSADLAEEEGIAEATVEPAMDFAGEEAIELRREDGFAAAAYAPSKAIAADSPSNECSEEIRSEPDSWLACIAALEAAGDKEAALRQRDYLEEAFPDFKLP